MSKQVKVEVLRGVSGAGKSTYVNRYLKEDGSMSVTVVSADQFMVDDEGNYAFDPTRLGECHNKCLAKFLLLLEEASGSSDPSLALIVVDNTNTTLWEASPYIQLALTLGHEVKVTTLLCDPRVAFNRCIHGTPAHAIMRHDAQIRESLLKMPSWWNQKVIWTDH
jgi:hypothetical protein